MNVSKETRNLVLSALFLTLAVIIQILGKSIPEISQFVVGPTVNAVLILTAYFAGLKWALLVGILTPVLAFVSGVLAAPMAPFIPFIAAGNLIYIVFFSLLKDWKNGEVLGIVLGALFKFAFLYFSASKLINLLSLGIPEPVKAKLVISMGIPQFITALVGGAAAILLYTLLNRRLKLK